MLRLATNFTGLCAHFHEHFSHRQLMVVMTTITLMVVSKKKRKKEEKVGLHAGMLGKDSTLSSKFGFALYLSSYPFSSSFIYPMSYFPLFSLFLPFL